MPPTATEPIAGNRKFRFRLSMEVLRHASNGPTAVRSRSSKSNRNGNTIEKRRPDRDFVALHEFRDDGEECAPQDGEADDQQEEIVEQETGFARDQRFEFVLGLEVRAVLAPGKNCRLRASTR